MIKLITGLGNIGEAYNNTRHNVGFKFIDAFAKKYNVELNRFDFNGEYGIATINDYKIILLKPHTYMNLSGKSLIACMNFFKIKKDEILVIYDDKDLKIGDYKYKMSGSAGGHNGIKDIINVLGSEEFKRIKIGIGSKPSHMDLAQYVLSKFSKQELEVLSKAINDIAKQLSYINIIDFSNLSSK